MRHPFGVAGACVAFASLWLLGCSGAPKGSSGEGAGGGSGGGASGPATTTGAGAGGSQSTSSGSTSSSGTTTSSSGSGGGVPAHRAWPELPKGKDVQHAPRVVVVVPQNEASDASALYTGLAQSVAQSAWYGAWSSDYPELGAARDGANLQGPAIAAGTSLDATTGAAYVQKAIAEANDPTLAPDGATTYVVTLPVGAWLAGQENASGVNGHHWALGAQGDAFALVQRDAQSDPQIVVQVATHEIAESMTDTGNGYALSTQSGSEPWKSSVWAAWEGSDPMAGGYIENGDFCEGSIVYENGLRYQRIYTNRAAKAGGDPCEPALAVPYFNVTTAQDWYAGTPGQDAVIDVAGWATGPVDDFWIGPDVASSRDGSGPWNITFDAPKTGTLSGQPTPQMNDGLAGKLHVKVPDGAAKGSWVIVSLWTWHADANNQTPDGEDSSHLFAVGVYVP